MGVENRNLYTADVTRTLPVDGTFTPLQRDLYTLVHAAQSAGIDAVRPGNGFMAPHHAAMDVLAHGLGDLGLLPCSVEEALSPDSKVYARWTLHSVSHMLGMDVHDCARSARESYHDGDLAPGMVLTVEPGLYFQEDDLLVPEELRGHRHPHRGRHRGHRGRPHQPVRLASPRRRRHRGVDGRPARLTTHRVTIRRRRQPQRVAGRLLGYSTSPSTLELETGERP